MTPIAPFPAARTRDVMNGTCPDKSENLLVVRQMNMIAIQTSKCIVIICRNYMSVLHLCQQYQMVFNGANNLRLSEQPNFNVLLNACFVVAGGARPGLLRLGYRNIFLRQTGQIFFLADGCLLDSFDSFFGSCNSLGKHGCQRYGKRWRWIGHRLRSRSGFRCIRLFTFIFAFTLNFVLI